MPANMGLPPDAFADDTAAVSVLGKFQRKGCLAACVLRDNSVAILQSELSGVQWMHQQRHKPLFCQFGAFIE